MNSFLGSRVFYALVLALFILGISFAVSRDGGRATIKDSSPKLSASGNVNLENLVSKDSDDDSVPDWEEYLWGTDMNNPDTYGRGLGDRAEIEKLRVATAGSGTGGQNNTPSDTDIFSRQLLSSLISLKQSGNLSVETLNNLSSSIIENIRLAAAEKTFYALSDLKIVGMSTSSVEKYRLDMLSITKKYASAGLGDELPALAEAVEKNNPAKLSLALTKIPIYQNLLAENLKMSVPSDLALYHLEAVNSYKNIIDSLGQMEKIWSDPVVGLVELTRYRNATNRLFIALGAVESYFALRDTIIGTTTSQIK